MPHTLHLGDCLDILRTITDNSVDAVVTDPPYGLSFMGKRWDYDVPSEDIWRECLRVLKPGGHLLAFAGTRTQHRMAVRIEDAGFEIRDMIAWVYGSGFPKSLDVSKAIDKAAGAERTEFYKKPIAYPDSDCWSVPNKNSKGNNIGFDTQGTSNRKDMDGQGNLIMSLPSTELARQWHGWGTALKPALEPITVARKPLIGTVAENVLTWGTGGVNVDGCRVEASDGRPLIESKSEESLHAFGNGLNGSRFAGMTTLGRWPANLIHDGSEEVVGLFPAQAGGGNGRPISAGDFGKHGRYGKASGAVTESYGDSGSAARFFYCAKASKRDRDEGCEGMEAKAAGGLQGRNDGSLGSVTISRNHHPTVKPTDLMRYLCRLVTPPDGTVLDPFMGSGSTGKAAVLEGFNFIGIEREPEYLEIARARITHAQEQKETRLL